MHMSFIKFYVLYLHHIYAYNGHATLPERDSAVFTGLGSVANIASNVFALTQLNRAF